MNNFFDGAYGKYLLPGVLIQSVLIGGGYATGREVYEYGAKFGAYGWVSGITIAIGFALLAVLTFELCRIYKTYDFKSFIEKVIGPLWPVFDALYVILMVFIIAIMAAATGSIVQSVLHLPMLFGEGLVILIVGILNFYGDEIIEKFETVGTVLLYAGYILFTIMVLSKYGDNIGPVLASGTTASYQGEFSMGLAVWTGILYVAYNICAIPMGMFSLKRQTERKETVLSGLFAGLLMTIPWFLTYFAMLCFYNDPKVVGANVATPWTEMIQRTTNSPLILTLFSIVLGWTLIETATGCIHALIVRINAAYVKKGEKPMSRGVKGGMTIGILALSLILSQVGVIDLIGSGYMYLAYAYILLYLVPVCTIGVYKILTYKETTKTEE